VTYIVEGFQLNDPTSEAMFGPMWRDCSTGELAGAYFHLGSASDATRLISAKFNSPTSWSNTYKACNDYYVNHIGGTTMWIRLGDDGSCRTIEYSIDGQTWNLFHNVGNTDFLVADQIGIAGDSWGSTEGWQVSLLHYEEA
jgi:hypothetical protein